MKIAAKKAAKAAKEADTESKSIEVRMEGLSPIIEEVTGSGKNVELTVTGSSMEPLLHHKVSVVRLSGATDLKRGDVPLYRRENGAYVLHRIIRKSDSGEYSMCGDNQWVLEPGIKKEQMIAKMTAFSRDGKKWTECESIGYKVYTRLWMLVRILKRIRHIW